MADACGLVEEVSSRVVGAGERFLHVAKSERHGWEYPGSVLRIAPRMEALLRGARRASGSYSTAIRSSASKAVSSSRAMTPQRAATKRTLAPKRVLVWLTGGCVGGGSHDRSTGARLDARAARTRDAKIARADRDRSSLQCTVRGNMMSSANRVWPVTFARASTRLREVPMRRIGAVIGRASSP